MLGMALEPIAAREVAETPTLFKSFMGFVDGRYKTVGQLLEIYRERSRSLLPGEDQEDHLRVERFVRDMAGNRWTSDLVLRIGVFAGTVHLIDGTHRSMAYLACLDIGVRPERLPGLHIDC